MKTKRLGLLFLLLITLFSFCQSQNIESKIVDSKTNEEIPFATIRFFAGGKLIGGIISNAAGDFQFPAELKISLDSMVISCIGYTNLRLKPSGLVISKINNIQMSRGNTLLKEIVVEGKTKRRSKPSAHDIVRSAIEAIPINYPQQSFSYLGYYRDYQFGSGQYKNLNEAIVEIFDQGFGTNDLRESKEKLYEYRENNLFPRDQKTALSYDPNKKKFIPGVSVYSFGGNELSILRINDAIRNYEVITYSFVNKFKKNFLGNHAFRMVGITEVNGDLLYRISFYSVYSGPGYQGRGEIYIQQSNFAIHKLSYSVYERLPKETLLYNIELEYSKIDSLMYLNYISCNNYFLLKIGDSRFVPVNQFRELFVQKVNRYPEAAQGPFIFENLTLKQNKIDTTRNSAGYWMNTPLKKQ